MYIVRDLFTSKFFALSVSAICALGMFAPHAASAADTLVSCASPEVQINSGRDRTTPRLTILCFGGSSAGSITAFAVPLDAANNFALIAERIVDSWISIHGANSKITLSSDLADSEGVGIGCRLANCRLLDYITGP